jgi:FAD dependent oxidoreductase TIGR03364
MPKNAIVIGAGIVGLSTARALAEQGWQVTVYERSATAQGASIRNFGMIWPIGQKSGKQYERAMRTKSIWNQICQETGYWIEESGSLHLAKSEEEKETMQELGEIFSKERPVQWISPAQIAQLSDAPRQDNLYGGLWSADEAIVESRLIIRDLPIYLQERYSIKFLFQQTITNVGTGFIHVDNKRVEADLIFICNGADFQTLYSSIFKNYFIKCKLQMMRLIEQPSKWRIGPSICGGLSLAHYKSFEIASSLPLLKEKLHEKYPAYFNYGIHVMVSQNHLGQLTIGDSHEYGENIDPFDKSLVNELVLNYLKELANFKDWSVIQTWNGEYAKLSNGGTEFIYEAEPGVWIINGFGGAGMTLALGTAEECCQQF